MTKNLIIAITLIFTGNFAFSQIDTVSRKPDTVKHDRLYYKSHQIKFLSLLAGYNFNKYNYLEIGIAKNTFGVVGPHPASSAYFVSVEVRPVHKFVMAPKIGGWFAGGLGGIAMGVNLLYYTNFNSGSLRFRPEIGLGIEGFKFVYGYNIALSNSAFGDVNKSNFGIVGLIPLKKYKKHVD